jgi:hypothetical protein
MHSIRHFVVLLSTAIMLLLACSALGGMRNLARTLGADDPAIPHASPVLAEGVVSILAVPRSGFARITGFSIPRPGTP